MRLGRASWIIAAVGGLAAAAVLSVWYLSASTAEREQAASSVEFATPMPSSESDGVVTDVAGVTRPRVFTPNDVVVSDGLGVVGISVGNNHRAYLLQEFGMGDSNFLHSIGRHVVNDVFGGVAVSVTHCDRNDCTRVFRTDANAPIDLRVGGWDAKAASLVLILDRKRYPQASADIPLKEMVYETTTWGKWKSQHPDTTIYVGPPAG